MKKIIALLIFILPVQSFALDAPDAKSVIPFSSRTGEVQKFGSYNPLSEADAIGETGFDFGTSASLGCSGDINANAFANFEESIERQYNYFKSNALGFGINYLAYQQPTFMQIMRFMNQDFSKYFDNLIFTCQSMRNLAISGRRDQEKQIERQNECMNSNGDLLDAATASCMEEEEQKDLADIYAKAEQAEDDLLSDIDDFVISSAPASNNSSYTGSRLSKVQASDIKKRFNGSSPDSLALVLSQGMQINDKQLQATASQLLDSVVYKRSGGKIEKKVEKRPKTLEKVLKEKTEHYINLIDDYVTYTLKDRQAEANLQASELDKDKATLPTSPILLSSLINMKEYNEASYNTHLKILSRMMSKSYLKYYITATGSIVNNSITKGILADAGYDLERETFENSLQVLSDELELIDVRDQGLADQHNMLQSIFRESVRLTKDQ